MKNGGQPLRRWTTYASNYLGFPILAAAAVIAAAAAALLALFVLLSLAPVVTHAEGSAADAMCNPVYTQCPCGKEPDAQKPGECKQGTNWYMCPNHCRDVTSGHVTLGHCVAPNKCHGDTVDGKPVEQPKPEEGGSPPNLPEIPARRRLCPTSSTPA